MSFQLRKSARVEGEHADFRSLARIFPRPAWIPVAVGLILALSGVSLAGTSSDELREVQQAIADSGASWTASENHITRMDPEERRAMLTEVPALPPGRAATRQPVVLADLPSRFSWGDVAGCNWMTNIRDQGDCGSCGVFAAVAIYEARERISMSQPSLYVDVSEQYLVSCPVSCLGGSPLCVFDHLAAEGCPDETCFPYSGSACDQLPCENKCADWADHVYTAAAGGFISMGGRETAKTEILTNGPIVTAMTVYSDFYSYSGGIYQHVSGSMQGGHYVAIYGWDDANNCWLGKNSWGNDWGEFGPDGQRGWFRFMMGTDDINCDDYIFYVDPLDLGYPQVVATEPQQNDPATARGTDISVAFDSDMDASTINAGTISVYGSIAGPYSATISYEAPSRTVLIDPDVDFKTGEKVSAVFSPDVSASDGTSLGTGYTLTFTAEAVPGSGVFGAPDEYSTDPGASDIITGDFDNDGYPDLVTVDTDAGNLTVRFGSSSGTFGAPVTYSVGTKPSSVTASDFTGNGYLDLAVFDTGSFTVVSLFNNGDGTFTLGATYPGPPGATALVSADFDADGDRDVLGARKSGSMMFVYRNTGTGVFETSTYSFLFNPLYSLAVSDIDSDGDLDLVYADDSIDRLTIMWNEGPGTFGSLVRVDVGNGARGVAVADFNGDTRPDPLIAHYTTQMVSILFNNGSNSYTSVEISTAPMSPESVCASDLNGDGHSDITVFGNTGIVALVNQGDGTFSAPLSLAAGEYRQGVAADFDADADLDLAVLSSAGDKIAVLLNTECIDSDGDGFGDPGQTGSLCVIDNCPSVANEEQSDGDGDGSGDACDLCPGYDDGLDADGDTAPDDCDNCPGEANSDQTDEDEDGVGDACDLCAGFDDRLDADDDGVPDDCDNCPSVSNADQADSDQNNVGDVCQTCCVGRVGDANNSGDEMPTIGDISVMIDAKFITGDCGASRTPPVQMIVCFAEADVNTSSGTINAQTCNDITIGDISMLIDYLFITGPENWDQGYGAGFLAPCP